MSNSKLQLESELRALCVFWDLPLISVDALPRKRLLNGEAVKGEENIVRLGERDTCFGPMQIFHSVDARDILGNANWARGWCSCLTHRENGKWDGKAARATSDDKNREKERARFDDARDVAMWAAQCMGVSLITLWEGKWKTQGGVKRRAFRARMWVFELECGALVGHALHGDSFELSDWLKEDGARFGLLTASQAHQKLVRASLSERLVKGSGPLCPALIRKRERVIWEGFNARFLGAPLKGARFWQATQTRLCLEAGCEV